MVSIYFVNKNGCLNQVSKVKGVSIPNLVHIIRIFQIVSVVIRLSYFTTYVNDCRC